MKRDDVSKFIIAAIEQMEQQELLDQAMADVGGTVDFLKAHKEVSK